MRGKTGNSAEISVTQVRSSIEISKPCYLSVR